MRLRSTITGILLVGAGVAQKTPVDAGLLAKLERYAAFASAAYSSDCTVPPYGSVVEKYFNVAATSTQATLFRDDAAKEYILSFRGTSDIQDFVTDLNQKLVACVAPGLQCLGCLCHQGYLGQYVSVEQDVRSALTSGMSAHSGYKLTVTGHSMGASIASIAAASLQGLGYTLTPYTYGQPRTGDPAYADYIDTAFPGNLYRVTHKNDGVPQIPLQSDGYRHHSTEYWQSDDPQSTANTFKCTGQEPPDCNQSERGTGIGNDGLGINLAHLEYMGVMTGDPLDPNAACGGFLSGILD